MSNADEWAERINEKVKVPNEKIEKQILKRKDEFVAEIQIILDP